MKSSEFKKRMIFNLVLIVSLVVTVASVSFAWFHDGHATSVSNVTVNILEGKEVMVSGDIVKWGLSVSDDSIDDIEFTPITGNGKKFFNPVYEYKALDTDSREKIYGNVLTGYSLIDPANYSNYLFQNSYYVRTNFNGTIYLSNETFIVPCDVSQRMVNGLNISADYIVGALRLCFEVLVDDEYVTKLIWIPKPNYKLTETSFTADGQDENQYTFVYGEYLSSKEYVSISGIDSDNLKTVSGITYLIGDFVSDFQLGAMEADTPFEVRITIWLDGNDRECRESLSGGKVKFDLALKVM